MMFYAVMKLLYSAYFFGVAYVIMLNLSRVSFSKLGYLKRIREVFKAIGFGFIWPLSLFSANGRKRLSFKTKGA